MAQSSSSATQASQTSYTKLENMQDEDQETPPRYSAGNREEHGEIDLENAALLKGQAQEHHESSPQLPAETDTADIIRDFLVNTLISKYNVSNEESHATASKWLMGTGKELRTFPPHVFREIFGGEAGWVIFKEVKIQLEEEKARKKREVEVVGAGKQWSKATKGWIAAGYCVTTIGVIITLIAVLGSTWTGTVAAVLGVLVLSMFVAIGVAASSDNDGAAMAEIELKQMYAKSVE